MIAPNLLLENAKRNLVNTKNPLGIREETVNSWWENINLNSDGQWLFFTGYMYQLAPFIDTILRHFERIEKSKIGQRIVFSRLFMDLSGLIVKRSYSENLKKECDQILSKIYQLLLDSGIDVFYTPQLDRYSGIMLYDLGDEKGIREHMMFISDIFEENGIDRIITSDPHTTYAMVKLFPEFTGNKLKVKSYLDLIKIEKSLEDVGIEFGVHDPCYYGRYLGLGGKISYLIEKSGIRCFIPENSGEMTSCCGGSSEYVSPIIAKEIAKMRLEEFNGRSIVTACPICLVSFRRAGGNVVDVATILG